MKLYLTMLQNKQQQQKQKRITIMQ